jgi:hypothetical protein
MESLFVSYTNHRMLHIHSFQTVFYYFFFTKKVCVSKRCTLIDATKVGPTILPAALFEPRPCTQTSLLFLKACWKENTAFLDLATGLNLIFAARNWEQNFSAYAGFVRQQSGKKMASKFHLLLNKRFYLFLQNCLKNPILVKKGKLPISHETLPISQFNTLSVMATFSGPMRSSRSLFCLPDPDPIE